jgi:hypothetical protein
VNHVFGHLYEGFPQSLQGTVDNRTLIRRSFRPKHREPKLQSAELRSREAHRPPERLTDERHVLAVEADIHAGNETTLLVGARYEGLDVPQNRFPVGTDLASQLFDPMVIAIRELRDEEQNPSQARSSGLAHERSSVAVLA